MSDGLLIHLLQCQPSDPFLVSIVFSGVPPGLAQELPSPIPLTTYNSAPVPAWDKLSFASLPNLQAGGELQVPSTVANQLGYNPFRRWQPGAALGDVLKLGDVQDAFGMEKFTLTAIANALAPILTP